MLNSTITTNLNRARLFFDPATSIWCVLHSSTNFHQTSLIRPFGLCWISYDVHMKRPLDNIKERMKLTSFCTSGRLHRDVQGGHPLVPSGPLAKV